MDALPYVDSLLREYLLFRGFTATLTAFGAELQADPGCGFQAERISELLFRRLIPDGDARALVDFLEHLSMGLYSRLDSAYEPLVAAVEADLLRLFLVTAHRAGRRDRVADFFAAYGAQLLRSSPGTTAGWPQQGPAFGYDGSGGGAAPAIGAVDWRDWLLLPHLERPEREPRFAVFFSAEWAALLEASFRNFIAGVVRSLPLPAVLRFNADRRVRLGLQQQVSALGAELERARGELAAARGELAKHQQQQQREVAAATESKLAQRAASPHQPAGSGGASSSTSSELPPRRHAKQSTAVMSDADSSAASSTQRGLFELLPLAAGAGPGAAPSSDAPDNDGRAGARQAHARVASFGGGISFDAAAATSSGADAGAATAAATDPACSDDEPLADGDGGGEPAVASAAVAHGIDASKGRSLAGAGGGAAPMATSPPLASWMGGLGTAGGMRPQHARPGAAAPPTAVAHDAGAAAEVLRPTPTPPRAAVDVVVSGGATADAVAGRGRGLAGDAGGGPLVLSPTGENVALPQGGAGAATVAVASPPGLRGNAARHASIACGAPVTALCWLHGRSDKLLLVGCSGGGGVRVWHVDTRRVVMAEVAATAALPVVAALACCSSEPTFAVACNSAAPQQAAGGGGGPAPRGQLSLYNSRSYRRAAALALPGDVGVVSLAYSVGGQQLLVGTVGGTALLYEPGAAAVAGARLGPLRVWHAAAAAASAQLSQQQQQQLMPVQALFWRQPPAGGGGGSGSPGVLTLCGGVLCEWGLGAGSGGGGGPPLAAVDAVHAAALAVAAEAAADAAGDPPQQRQQQQQELSGEEAANRAAWACHAAVAADGVRVAVLCATAAAGALLLFDASSSGGGGSGSLASCAPQALLAGKQLAGGGGVAFTRDGDALVCSCAGGGLVTAKIAAGSG